MLLLSLVAAGGTACILTPAQAGPVTGDTSDSRTVEKGPLDLTPPRTFAAPQPTDMAVAAASRSADRQTEGTWTLGDANTPDTGTLTRIRASSPTVATLMDGRDRGQTPEGFDPDHATGDTGNAYAFSQCTWWAYVRRHQLGLPVGSHMGDGAMWADSARRLGYWVDSTPRQGDVMVFRRGQDGASPVYGHVAIVERVNADGSVVTSECGATYHGRPFSRTFTAEQASRHEYVHY